MARPLRIEVTSATQSDDELVMAIKQLQAKNDGLRQVKISMSDGSSPWNSNVFARLFIEPPHDDQRARRQPANELCRQIRFQCASGEDLEQQLQQFFDAVLG
jgi:hypothetical protein